MSAFLSIASIATGAVSAALWLWSALVRIPKGSIPFTSHAGGGTPNPQIDKLVAALHRQSRLSAAAAALTALSVAAQAMQQLLQH